MKRKLFCLLILSTILLTGCAKKHSFSDIEEFAEEIDRHATVDSDYTIEKDDHGNKNYMYDAEIDGIKCHILDRNHATELGSRYYVIETDYTYQLYEKIYKDIKYDYNVSSTHKYENGTFYEYDDKYTQTFICLNAGDKEDFTESDFNEYWRFYCDMTDEMSNYAYFNGFKLDVECNDGQHNKCMACFSNTNQEEYDAEYERCFGP